MRSPGANKSPLVAMLGLLMCCMTSIATAQVQEVSSGQEEPAALPATVMAGNDSPVVLVGGGWQRYSEPQMLLQGPRVSLSASWTRQLAGHPFRLDGLLAGADLRYSSRNTGSISHAPGLSGHIAGLWQLSHAGSELWSGGLQLELDWTDLHGTSSTGHHGYRRQGTKAWLILEHDNPQTGRLQGGWLLRGRQFSQLSDVPQQIPLANVVNTQRRGAFLKYEYTVTQGALKDWQLDLRYMRVEASDKTGQSGWYEPRNQTWVVDLKKSW